MNTGTLTLYRNIGSTSISPDLWAGLQKMTTYSPQNGGWPDNDGMPETGRFLVM